MRELRERLDERARAYAADPSGYERVLSRVERRRRSRRLGTGATALVIAALVIAGLRTVSALGPEPGSTPAPAPSPTATSQPVSGLEVGLVVRHVGWRTAEDAIGLHVLGAGTLSLIDPETGSSQVVAHGPWDYDFALIAPIGNGKVLVADGTSLWTVDSSGSVTTKVDLSALGYIGELLQAGPQAGGGTWVTTYAPMGDGPQSLSQVDPATGAVLTSVPAGHGAHEILEASGYLFAARNYDPALIRIDPRTGDVTTIDLDRTPTALAAVGDNLWWVGSAINCLNMRTLTDCGRVDVPRAVSLAADGHRVWVLSAMGTKTGTDDPDPSEPATITLLDGATGAVISGPMPLPGRTPASLFAYGGHAWIGFHDSGTVLRIDQCVVDQCTP